MITDRISLNIALKHLDQFEQNDGEVIDILFSMRRNDKDVSKTVKFNNIYTLKSFIERYTPEIKFSDADCMALGLFELKSFSLLMNATDKNFIMATDEGFITKSSNITPSLVENLNIEYLTTFDEIHTAFNGLLLNEYIFQQHDYIECGYIEIYFPNAILKLKELYNKYKKQ